MRILTTLLASSGITLGLVLIGCGILMERSMQETALREAVHQAIAVVGAAEEARDHTSALLEGGGIDLERLLQKGQ